MIKFGPAGNDILFNEQGYTSSLDAPKWVKEFGLDCYEYSCGRGIKISPTTAKQLGEVAKQNQIEISVHAPYYINFANHDDEMAEKSFNYVVNSLKLVKLMGGKRVVVHPASCGKMPRDEAVELTKKRLHVLRDLIYQLKLDDCYICLESMGKLNQIGNYEETIDFCSIDKIFLPCFDFGHINSFYQGILKTSDDYEKIIKLAIDKLGYEKVKMMHVHFSKIEYGPKGELRHLTLEDKKYGPEFEPLVEVLKKYKLEPYIICESKDIMAQDALNLKKIYYNSLIF